MSPFLICFFFQFKSWLLSKKISSKRDAYQFFCYKLLDCTLFICYVNEDIRNDKLRNMTQIKNICVYRLAIQNVKKSDYLVVSYKMLGSKVVHSFNQDNYHDRVILLYWYWQISTFTLYYIVFKYDPSLSLMTLTLLLIIVCLMYCNVFDMVLRVYCFILKQDVG